MTIIVLHEKPWTVSSFLHSYNSTNMGEHDGYSLVRLRTGQVL
jgi:hypothetical protein